MSKNVQLKVLCSTIDGQGKAKLNHDAFLALELKPGDRVTVACRQQSVVVEAYPDTVYKPESIRLQATDIAALCAGEGDAVTVFDGEVVAKPKPAPKKKKR